MPVIRGSCDGKQAPVHVTSSIGEAKGFNDVNVKELYVNACSFLYSADICLY